MKTNIFIDLASKISVLLLICVFSKFILSVTHCLRKMSEVHIMASVIILNNSACFQCPKMSTKRKINIFLKKQFTTFYLFVPFSIPESFFYDSLNKVDQGKSDI